MEWYPRAMKRTLGRPPARWRDPIVRLYGVTWSRTSTMARSNRVPLWCHLVSSGSGSIKMEKLPAASMA
ncbi:unnamed protein product [Gongylonema pulchrum]|uniref:Uncharacterized protein n=1 Tax=Gongylonema pulchrum TaxID=637853 RepID=A0A183E5N4_9BILA|nr:unnamed protein product [Gongylonema pulchrum]